MRYIFFILLLIPWFLSTIIFPTDIAFYESLNLPFKIPGIIFGIAWTTIYILLAFSSYKIINKHGFNKEYITILVINYIFNQLYTYFFFILKSPFLGFVDSVIIFVTTIILYYETKELDEKSSKLLLPYIFWDTFAVIYGLLVFFMNL
jgi:tryptophan-rich sensory protein